MNKKLAGTGLAIGLVAGAGAGLILELAGNAGAAPANLSALAVSDSTVDTTGTTDTTAPSGTTDTSGTTGTTGSPDANRPDPTTKLQEVLKPLVDDGTITQDQADKVIAAIIAARPADGGHGPFGGHRGFGGGPIGIAFDTVATTLGMTTDEVRTALQNGQTLADLAVSKGKTGQDVIDALVTEAKTHLDQAVTDGKLTQTQADTILTELTTRVTDFVNNGLPAGGFPGFGRGFGHGDDDGDGTDGSSSGSGDTTATTAPATTAGN